MRGATFAVGFLLLAGALAGCATSGGGTSSSDNVNFGDKQGTASATTGVLRGVIVSTAIVPIAGANVAITAGATTQNQTTDSQGRFLFSNLPPGTYLVKATHLLYNAAQTTVDVVAGVDNPSIARIQMEAKFSQKAYSTQVKFEGFIECGYDAVLITSLCVNDYSTLVVHGGCCPQLRTLVDNRGYVGGVDQGWQTLVYELTWAPSASGTSQAMLLLVSYVNRTASDWFATTSGQNPVQLRLEVNVTDPSQAGARDKINPTGENDLYTFAGVAAGGGLPVGAGFQQRFTIYQSNFYYGSPPKDWSFVKGDPLPF